MARLYDVLPTFTDTLTS